MEFVYCIQFEIIFVSMLSAVNFTDNGRCARDAYLRIGLSNLDGHDV